MPRRKSRQTNGLRPKPAFSSRQGATITLLALSILYVAVCVSLNGAIDPNTGNQRMSIGKLRESKQSLFDDPLREPFCVPWTVDIDEWWVQNPQWEIAIQNRTFQCFSPIPENEKSDLLNQLFEIQFHDKCNPESVVTKVVSNSGWGVDFAHVVDGLQLALSKREMVAPVLLVPWQYSVGRTHRTTRDCKEADMSCYFLPLSSCASHKGIRHFARETRASFTSHWYGFYNRAQTRWLIQYATRAKTWLRKEATLLAASLHLQSPCTVFHVRRADVVLHGRFSRQYHKVEDYFHQGGSLVRDNILLLTDDANAIGEAQRYVEDQCPSKHLFYIDRQRHAGAEGGFENQIPSGDPRAEVTVLMAITQLVQQCDVIVHSKSNLSDMLLAFMMEANPFTKRVDLDQGKRHDEIHNAENAATVVLSRPVAATSKLR